MTGTYVLVGVLFVVFTVLTAVQALRFDKARTALDKELSDARTEISLLHVAARTHADKMFATYREDMQVMAQRIQAPELAVVEHQQKNVEDPDGFPLTDEQLAQQQELAAFIERAEQLENENLGILS